MGGPGFDINTDVLTAAKAGIGTNSFGENEKVTVVGADMKICMDARADHYAAFRLKNNVRGWLIQITPSTDGNGRLRIYEDPGVGSSQGERLTVLPGGNIGIGTPAPGEKLEVNGNAKVSGKGTFGGATTEGLTIGNARIYALGDQGNPSRLDIWNGVVEVFGVATDPNGGVYIRIASAAEGGQGAFRVRNLANDRDMLRVTAAGEVYVNEVKAINAQGQCVFAP